MRREPHVRFCERLRGKFPRSTRLGAGGEKPPATRLVISLELEEHPFVKPDPVFFCFFLFLLFFILSGLAIRIDYFKINKEPSKDLTPFCVCVCVCVTPVCAI